MLGVCVFMCVCVCVCVSCGSMAEVQLRAKINVVCRLLSNQKKQNLMDSQAADNCASAHQLANCCRFDKMCRSLEMIKSIVGNEISTGKSPVHFRELYF